MSDAHDPVNAPAHYRGNGMEAIDVIEAFALGFRLGNAVKYILRAGRKGDVVEDLEKAAWYLRREIEKRKDMP
jgi:rRNA processing protein Krr1/Pno1